MQLGLRGEHRLRRHVGSEVRDRDRRHDLRDDVHRACASAATAAAASRPRPPSSPPGSPNRIADIWIDALDIGPTGDVWVGTAESGQPNDVYVSTDNGMTFTPTGLQSPTIWWKSVKVAPSERDARLRHRLPGRRHADRGHMLDAHATTTAAAWTRVAARRTSRTARRRSCSSPRVDPTNPDVVYVISQGANPPSGDKLYRSTDGGATLTEVLATTEPIRDVVIRDAQTVLVTTMTQSGMTFIGGPAYQSTTAARRSTR